MRRACVALLFGLSTAPVLTTATVAFAEDTGLPSAFAYNYGETETARAAALGGAARAFGDGATALYQNPSAMVSSRVYHIEALAQLTPEVARQAYGGSIVDSVTGRLAGGVGIVGGFIDPDGIDRSYIDARLGLGFPITDSLFVGAAGRYAKVNQAGLGPLGDSVASGGLVDPEGGRFAFVDTFSFDAGVTALLGDSVRVAVVGQNLSYPNNTLLPTTLSGGIGYGTRELTVEVDGLADFNSYGKTTGRIMAGGEYRVSQHVPIRLGYRYDQGAELHALSGGLGYVGDEFSFEASVRRTLSDPGATTIVIGLAYFLESSGFTRAPQGFE